MTGEGEMIIYFDEELRTSKYVEERMSRLMGQKVTAEFDSKELMWWELEMENGVAFTMLNADFSYSDEELIEKLVVPIFECIARNPHEFLDRFPDRLKGGLDEDGG